MAASTASMVSAVGNRRRRRRAVMSEINVTPFVDVMLVLLIVFMVSAPLLTVGVPIDLPQSQAKALEQNNEPLAISVNEQGQIFLRMTKLSSTIFSRSSKRSSMPATAAPTILSTFAATRPSPTAR